MANKQKILTEAQKHIQKGNYAKAVREYERAVELDPEDLRVLLKLGEARQKAGDMPGAIDTYQQVALQYSSTGFLLKAAAVYKRILGLDRNNVEVHLRLAEVYHSLGLLSDAMSFYYAVANLLQQANDAIGYQDVLERMAAIEPENVGIRIKLAEHYSRIGSNPEAVEQFTHAASQLKRQGRLDDYIKVAERLIFHDPQALDTIKDLARLYLQRGDTRRALAKIQLCTRADPHDPETLELLVDTFLALDQHEKAYQVLREKARLHTRNNETTKAQDAWRRLLEAYPSDTEARDCLGLDDPNVVQATPEPTAQHTPAPQEPEHDYEAQAREIERLLAETDVYIKYGLHDQAYEHLRNVFLMDPNNLDAMERIKEMHYQAGYYPQAVDELLRMTKLAYLRDRERAFNYLREAIGIIPDSHEALELAASYGLTRDDLFPQGPLPLFDESIPGQDSVDTMLAQLTAEMDDGSVDMGDAPLGDDDIDVVMETTEDADLQHHLRQMGHDPSLEVISRFDNTHDSDDVPMPQAGRDDGLIRIDASLVEGDMIEVDLDEDIIDIDDDLIELEDSGDGDDLVAIDDADLPSLGAAHAAAPMLDEVDLQSDFAMSDAELAELSRSLGLDEASEDEPEPELLGVDQQPLMEELLLGGASAPQPPTVDGHAPQAGPITVEVQGQFGGHQAHRVDVDDDDMMIDPDDDLMLDEDDDMMVVVDEDDDMMVVVDEDDDMMVVVDEDDDMMVVVDDGGALDDNTPIDPILQAGAEPVTVESPLQPTPPRAANTLVTPPRAANTIVTPPRAANTIVTPPGAANTVGAPPGGASPGAAPLRAPLRPTPAPSPLRPATPAASLQPATSTPAPPRPANTLLTPPPAPATPAPPSRPPTGDRAAIAKHFRQEVVTATYTPASARGTVTEADLSADEPEGATQAIDIFEFQRRMASAATQKPAPDQIPQELRLDLEECDFYIQQGLVQEATATLHDLRGRWNDHPAIMERLQKLGASQPKAPLPDTHRTAARPAIVPVGASLDPPSIDTSGPLSFPALDDSPALESAGQGTFNSHFELGLAYREMGLHEDAINELRQAINDQEQIAESYFLIGQSCIDTGDLREAVSQFKHALKAARTSPQFQPHILYRLGLTYEAQGENVEAAYYFKRVATRTDLFPDVTQRLSRLGH